MTISLILGVELSCVRIAHFEFQERPEKPDVPWLTTALWNTCCDLEDALPVFKGLTSDIIATPVHCKAGRIEVSTYTH